MTFAEVGGIYRVVSMTPGVSAALVLVIGVDEAEQTTTVVLLSPDIELGGSSDLLLEPEETGLAYSILVEADVVGLVPVTLLDRNLGRVGERVVASIMAARSDEEVNYKLAGPAVTQRLDPRWKFKISELRRFQIAVSATDYDFLTGGEFTIAGF